jgi:hypothetical protein
MDPGGFPVIHGLQIKILTGNHIPKMPEKKADANPGKSRSSRYIKIIKWGTNSI